MDIKLILSFVFGIALGSFLTYMLIMDRIKYKKDLEIINGEQVNNIDNIKKNNKYYKDKELTKKSFYQEHSSKNCTCRGCLMISGYQPCHIFPDNEWPRK